MNNPKAQFQINNGSGWHTIAEAEIINGIVQPPNAWTMVRAMQKQIVYTGYTTEKITVAPSGDKQCDTHFSGFARALWKDLLDANSDGYIDVNEWDDPTDTPNYIKIIARRAYDLVLHTLWQTTPASGSTIAKYQGLTIAEIANAIPGLPELPKVEE
jgi:hypothetical protein